MKTEGDNSSGVASVILGILSLSFLPLTLFAFFAPVAALGLAICSLLFARNQAKHSANKWSKAGYYLSIVSIIINGLITFYIIKTLLGIVGAYTELCKAAGGCDKIAQYLQSQQLPGAIA